MKWVSGRSGSGFQFYKFYAQLTHYEGITETKIDMGWDGVLLPFDDIKLKF